jgi:hypothetical protein
MKMTKSYRRRRVQRHVPNRFRLESLENRILLADFDFGDAPETYATTLSANGPRHQLGSGLALHCGTFTGSIPVDDDLDGQPSTFADDDDLDKDGFDEDGLEAVLSLTPGSAVTVEVCATAAGRLDAFIDFNDDGDFADTGEKIFNDVAVMAGTNMLTFTVPANATGGADAVTFSRFRISSTGGLSFTGEASDGEVEDHSVDIVQPPQFDFGDAPNSYGTLLAADGARHEIVTFGAFLGDDIDSEPNGLPNNSATGDDNNQSPDDEDGVTFGPLVVGKQVDVTVVANLRGAARGGIVLDAFIDFNADGDFADAGEEIFDQEFIATGPNMLQFVVPASAAVGDTFARFRVSSQSGVTFNGAARSGEVEDYLVTITGPMRDFGDAPASYGNPNHELASGPVLGNDIDSEATGQPSNTATGDDNASAPDDEDGVTFVGSILVGATANVNVEVNFVGSTARLDAFLDFNDDGDFADTGEKIFDNLVVVEGTNSLSFPVPGDAATGFTFARFRVSSSGGLSFDGPAPDGEVEDFRVRIVGAEGGCEDVAVDLPDAGAGNVKVRLSGGTLRVRGDVLGNGLVIEAGAGPGSYRITGLGATTINRQVGAQEFAGVTGGMRIGLLGGPDVLLLDGSSAALAVTGKLRIRSGTGSTAILDRIVNSFGDQDVVRIVDVLLEAGLSVRLRRNGDDLGLCGLDALGPVRTGEGLGPDTFALDDGTLDDRYRTGVGHGPDVMRIEQQGGPTGPSTEFNGRVRLRGRRGNDSICIGNVGESGNSASFHGRTRIRGGRGRRDSIDGLNNGANTFDSPPVVVGIEQVDAGNPTCAVE